MGGAIQLTTGTSGEVRIGGVDRWRLPAVAQETVGEKLVTGASDRRQWLRKEGTNGGRGAKR